MNKCQECGEPCRDEKCLDCRYRHGGKLADREETVGRTLVELFARRSNTHLRAGFTADQIQQISEFER